MPQRLIIEVDGKRVEIDQPMHEADARQWLFDQAVLLTRREPIVVSRRQSTSQPD